MTRKPRSHVRILIYRTWAIGDTVNINWMFQIEHKLVRIPTGGRLTSWLFTPRGRELNSGQPRTNPDSTRVEDLNLGPPDFKSIALNHSATLPPWRDYNRSYFLRAILQCCELIKNNNLFPVGKPLTSYYAEKCRRNIDQSTSATSRIFLFISFHNGNLDELNSNSLCFGTFVRLQGQTMAEHQLSCVTRCLCVATAMRGETGAPCFIQF